MNSNPVDFICNFQFTEASKPNSDKSFPYRGLSQTSRKPHKPPKERKEKGCASSQLQIRRIGREQYHAGRCSVARVVQSLNANWNQKTTRMQSNSLTE